MELRISQTANIYAEALTQLKEDIKSDFNNIIETFTNELYETLDNPTLPLSTKNLIIDEIFSNKINQKLVEFLKMLTKKNRIKLISEIYEAYIQKTNSIENIQIVNITSAVNLRDEQKKQIIKKLQENIGKIISPNWSVSEDIIAGLVIKINDTIIDTSLKNKIDKLSNIMR